MARGIDRALKSKAEIKKGKKEKRDQLKKENENNQQEDEAREVPSFFKSENGKRSPFATVFIKVASVFLLLYLWSVLYLGKYIPYKQQNEMLTKALKDPSLIKRTVEYAYKNPGVFSFMDEEDAKERTQFFEKLNEADFSSPYFSSPDFSSPMEKTENNDDDDDDDEVPVQEGKKEIPPEDDNDVEVIGDMKEEKMVVGGDMKEEITGGEIYTVDEIFKKLGIEKITGYKAEGEYERNLLKEFRLDNEMPDNIAKKADYYKPIIERGLKEDERFFVKKINDKKGYGLFARVDIAPNEVLGVYTGVIHATDSEKGKKYEWYYSTIPDRKLEKMVELRVNGKHEGSHLRFVNHSLYYNARVEYVPYNDQWYILFISNRYIYHGEEITVNYREKTKRMPTKIIDKWDKTEEEELKKLYDEYMKLKAQQENQQTETATEEKKAPVKEEL